MSRQEVYSWASILSSVVVVLVYIGLVFGIPSLFEPVKDGLIDALVILIVVDIVFQIVISVQESGGGRISKDERDQIIESKGFKVGYYVFSIALVALIGHLFVLKLMGSFADPEYLDLMDSLTLHYLVFAFITGTTSKSITQVVLYRKEA